jgi:hypothetical protein
MSLASQRLRPQRCLAAFPAMSVVAVAPFNRFSVFLGHTIQPFNDSTSSLAHFNISTL